MHLLVLLLFVGAAKARGQQMKHGTAIAVIRTPTEIVVAADSKEVNTDGSPNTNLVCKIRRFGDSFVVVNGMADNGNGGFNVFSLLDKATHISGGILEKISRFEALVKVPLEEALSRVRQKSPIEFQRNCIQTSPLGVTFFGLENNTLFMYGRRFVVTNSVDESVKINVERHACPGLDCPGGIAASFVAPISDDAEKFQRDNPAYWKSNLVTIARQFVQMEIDKNGGEVGPPIDIVRITLRGPEWLQRKKGCADNVDK